jgi:hypothetical protein
MYQPPATEEQIRQRAEIDSSLHRLYDAFDEIEANDPAHLAGCVPYYRRDRLLDRLPDVLARLETFHQQLKDQQLKGQQ